MFKISMALIGFISLTINLLAQSDVSKSRWKSQEIVIDGNGREWPHPLNFYDDKSGVLFAICNDQTNVYFAFTVNDEMKMRKLMSAGWSVELSSKEKNNKFSANLSFPAVKMEGMGNKRPGSEFEKKAAGNPFIEAYKLQLQSVEINGFQTKQATVKLNDRNAINIALGADSTQRIFYEIAIPLKELRLENIVEPDELITLNVSVNALARPTSGDGGRDNMQDSEMYGMNSRQGGSMSAMGGGMGGGMGGMGGGRQGGGMQRGGGHSGSGPGDRSGLFEKVSFKQKFRLAKE